jgi:ATP-dependent protease ClpP protease subunit
VKNWFQIQSKGTTAEILIFDEIGAFGISAKQFSDELKAMGDVGLIKVRINSVGGDVFEGIAIYNMLKHHPARVEVMIDGIAASIASVIAMAGDKISMPENAVMMIHRPFANIIGDADDMRDMADALEKIAGTLVISYRRSGQSDEQIMTLMSAETWLTAGEAVAAGFADEIVPAVKIAAFFDLKRFRNAPMALTSPVPSAPAPDLEQVRVQAAADAADAERARTVAVVDMCADIGRPELAGDFVARGLTVDQAKAEFATRTADECKAIVGLCITAGVPDLAEKFLAQNRSLDWVQNRLKDAGRIRARCAAAHLPERADLFIRAGVTVEEAAESLFDVLQALQGPEIDGRLTPAGFLGADKTNGARKPIDPVAISEAYKARERSFSQSEEDKFFSALAAKLRGAGPLR